MNIVLFGPPGAGKGTQSKMICEEFNLLHISTGDILRSEIKSKSDLGNNVKKLTETGQLVEDDIIIEIIKVYIEKHSENFLGFLFDGFPRTENQADLLSSATEGKNSLIEKLRTYFDDTSRDKLLERKANENDFLQKELNKVPFTIFIG